jgi:hypothetical protein
MTPLLWSLVPLIAMAVGLGKGGLGGAFAGLITPLLSLFIPVTQAIALVLPMLIIGDWISMRLYWGDWDQAQVKRLLPLGFVGIIAGSYLLVSLPAHTLRQLLGVMSLLLVAYRLLERRWQEWQYQPQAWHPPLAGFAAGTASAVASSGGPVMTAYLLLQGLKPRPFIATTTCFFALTNLARLPALLAEGVFKPNMAGAILLALPFVWLGTLAGRWLIDRLDRPTFEALMTALLGLAGVILVVR